MIDPSNFMPTVRLPESQGWKQMRDRLWARFQGKLYSRDFDLTFDAVYAWLDGRRVDLDQAHDSAVDIAVVHCGVAPRVIIQRCEKTGVCMLTMQAKSSDRKDAPMLSHTRTICILDPETTPEVEPVQLHAKRG